MINYDDIGRIREEVALQDEQFAPSRLTRCTGAVERYIAPSTVIGWVFLRRPSGLVTNINVHASVDGEIVGSTAPTVARPDVVGDASHKAGFKLEIRSAVDEVSLMNGKIRIFATDERGNQYTIRMPTPR